MKSFTFTRNVLLAPFHRMVGPSLHSCGNGPDTNLLTSFVDRTSMRISQKTSVFRRSLAVNFLIASSLVQSGCGSEKSVVQPPPQPPPASVKVSVSPSAVSPGQSATLTWSSGNTSSCVASGSWTGAQQTSGSMNLLLATPAAMSYTLACTGPGGSATQTATLAVAPPAVACTVRSAVATHAGRRISRNRKLPGAPS